LNQDQLLYGLYNIKKASTRSYQLVVEHGDFAPWNLIRTKDGKLQVFDFEYFSDQGIEFMDIFNYYYQKGKLLMKLEIEALINYMKDNIRIDAFNEVLKLFLINKILYQVQELSLQSYERELLLKITTFEI
jgi:thiamine kinase-like enzyme